jgi:hypothetical protein
MQKSNLINILRTFSKKELRDFKKWLQSPLHNQREDVVRMYDYLLTDNHLFAETDIEKSRVYKFVYPKERFDDAKMRQVMFFFNAAMEKYLVFAHFAEDEIRQQSILAGIYGKRNLVKPFKKTVADYETIKSKQTETPDSHFLFDYFLQKEVFDFTNKHERSNNTNLDEVQNALDVYYFVNKLKLACASEYYNKVFKTNYSTRLIEHILALNETDEIQASLFKIYILVYKLIKFPSEENHFEELKMILTNDTAFLVAADAKEVYLWAINYCIAKVNSGRSEFNRDMFDLYKKGIEERFLIEDNMITPFTFKNVISRGILLREFDWVEHFIANYQHYLEEDSRKGIVDFNMAMLYYMKKDYKKSQRLLISLEIDDLLINLNARFLLIKIYVEQNEYDLLEPQLDNMRAYLNRKDLIGYHKTTYKNVISVLKKMLKIRSNDKVAKEKLSLEVKELTPLVDKEWFLKQIELM